MPDQTTLLPISLSNAPAQAVALRFAGRPTLRQIVGHVLAASILEQYPSLPLDPQVTRLAVPNRTGGWDFILLIDVALDFLAHGTRLDLTQEIDGRTHFLSNQLPSRLYFTGSQGPGRPDMAVIQDQILALADTLGTHMQNALSDYWNQLDEHGDSHWKWLGDLLASGLSSATSLLPVMQTTARDALYQLARHPDRRARKAIPCPGGFVHAWCLETRLLSHGQSHSLLSPDLLIVQAERVFLYRSCGRLESYPDMHAFNQAWGSEVERQFQAETLVIERSEPDGNIFDTQAALLLERQLQSLDALRFPADQGVAALERRIAACTDPSRFFRDAPAPVAPAMEKIHAALPQWLKDGTDTQRDEYRQLLVEQARLQRLTAGKSFLDGIDNLQAFTLEALRAQLRLDHPDVQNEPQDLLLNFHVAAGDLGSGFVTHVPMPLSELAIRNLSAMPSRNMTVSDSSGKAVPAWLNADYILGVPGLFSSTEGLISRVNIGQRYPQQLKALLLDDAGESARRASLFGQMLKVQLPLQALEHAIRGEHGLSFHGYRCVRAVLHSQAPERVVDGQDIVIRPLAFIRQPGASADVVENMFIIEPRDIAVGPHILYRPVYRDALLQFASREALFEAIAHTGALQDSVLSWLPDKARPIYSHDGFNSPHILQFLSGDDSVRWEKPQPAQLAQDTSAQALASVNLTQYLYTCNARALVDLADRESVSNAESRWAIVREGGWLLFNTILLPVLSGPAMLAGWMLQLAVSLNQDIPALHSDDPTARELAWVDLLLNVGLLLMQLSSRGHPPLPVHESPDPALHLAALRRAPEETFVASAVIEQGATGLPASPPAGDSTQIDFIHSSARDSSSRRLLNALLELHVDWPVPAPEPVDIGIVRGLYRIDHQWYGSVAGLLFKVTVDLDLGEVYLIHPHKPGHPGFKLQTDGQGHWTLDRGLKLRGGGPKNRLQNKLAEIEKKRQQVRDEVGRIGEKASQLISQARDLDHLLSVAKTAYEKNHNELGVARARLRASPDDQQLMDTQRFKVLARSRSRLDFQVLQEREEIVIDQLIQARRELIEAFRQLKEVDARFDFEGSATDEYHKILGAHVLRIHRLTDLYLASFISEQGEPLIERQHKINDIEGSQRMYDMLENNFAASERYTQAMIAFDEVLTELAQNFKTGPAIRLKFLKDNPRTRYYNRDAAVLESLDVLNTLSVDFFSDASTPQEQYFIKAYEARRDDMVAFENSHLDLMITDGFTPQERKDVLSNVIKHYEERLTFNRSLQELGSPLIRQPFMDLLMTRLETARSSAEAELADLLREDEFLPPSSAALKTLKVPSNTKRVFKSRDKGALVGELEPAQAGMPFATMVSRHPVTLQVGGRFMEHPGEGWVEIVDAAPVKPTLTPPPRAFAVLRAEGQRLIDEVPAIERSIDFQRKKLADPLRRDQLNPRDWNDMLGYQAERIETLAGELERTHAEHPQLAGALETLRSGAAQARLKGQQHCIEGFKAQRPREENIQYLRDHQAVDIGLVQALKRTAAKDYLTEFAIREKNSLKVLWYAHFHYAQASSTPASYSVAHLKRPEHRFITLKDLIAKAGADNTVIVRDLYSPITAPRDQRLFLSLLPN